MGPNGGHMESKELRNSAEDEIWHTAHRVLARPAAAGEHSRTPLQPPRLTFQTLKYKLRHGVAKDEVLRKAARVVAQPRIRAMVHKHLHQRGLLLPRQLQASGVKRRAPKGIRQVWVGTVAEQQARQSNAATLRGVM
mmetsp:Transcript_28632/g.72424  ORF Transcript_28632/g.72424 Transcript_28632/m.72424 type:complete len:137 (-) Transcript_28632:1949-2359(-)